ncbi:MAG: ABC transporter permease [Actinobacteria bacterium]|nr:ABC transporter permease [Actinomycetota bacterium]
MDLIYLGFKQAFIMIFKGDRLVFEIALRSLIVSGTAVAISMIIGISLGLTIALARFPGRRVLLSLVNTGMGLPPTAVGLFVALLLARRGLFGFAELLYTKQAMIVAQTVIATPIVAGLTVAAVQNLNPKLRLQSLALGATRAQMLWTLIKEAKLPMLAAVMAGFGGVISEVGAVMMVGGNVTGDTQVLTTAVVEYVGKGNFPVAIALSLILLTLIFLVNFVLTQVQQRETSSWPKRISK